MNEEITQELIDSYTIEQEYKEKIISYITYNILKYRDAKIFEGYILNKLSKFSISYYNLYQSLLEKTEEIEDIINYYDENSIHAKINSIIQCITKKYQTNTYAGSYIIKNKNNGTIYLGESIDIFQRMTQHISDLYSGIHHNAWLQQDFNTTHCINNFEIKPLYIYDIGQKDKNEAKHDTLYIEAAYFISFIDQGIALYNTADPYEDLKNNKIDLPGYKINHMMVLQLLYNDEHCIMDRQLRNRLRKNLKETFPGVFDAKPKGKNTINPTATIPVTIVKKSVKQLRKEKAQRINNEQYLKLKEENRKEMVDKYLNGELTDIKSSVIDEIKKYMKENNIDIPTENNKAEKASGYRRNKIYRELVDQGFLPESFDVKIINKVLEENGLIYVNDKNRTIATEYSLSNNYFILSKTKYYSEE